MKPERKNIVFALFLATTLALAIFFSCTMYLWISVGLILRSLEEFVSVGQVEALTQGNSTLMNVTVSIRNALALSYMRLYVALMAIDANNETIPLVDYYTGQLPGTYETVNVPALSSAAATLSFVAPSNSSYLEQPTSLTFSIRALVTTMVNEGSPHTVDFYKALQPNT